MSKHIVVHAGQSQYFEGVFRTTKLHPCVPPTDTQAELLRILSPEPQRVPPRMAALAYHLMRPNSRREAWTGRAWQGGRHLYFLTQAGMAARAMIAFDGCMAGRQV